MLTSGKCGEATWVCSLFGCSILIFFASYTPNGDYFNYGIDASYRFAYNYFFANDIQIGKDILFTYGPFGFLMWPGPIGNNLIVGALAVGVSKLLFIFLALYLNYESKLDRSTYSLAIALTLTLVISVILRDHDLWIFITAILCLLHHIKGQSLWMVSAGAVVAFALMIKASNGVTSLAVIVGYWLFMLIRGGQVRLIVLSALTLCASFIICYFFLYQDIAGIHPYLMSMIELSKGNSRAMTINPDNDWLAFAVFSTSMVLLPFLFRGKGIMLLALIMLVPTALYFKYSFSREDTNHLVRFAIYTIELWYLILIASDRFSWKHLMLFPITISLLLFFTPDKVDKALWRHVKLSVSNLMTTERYRSIASDQSRLEKITSNVLAAHSVNRAILRIVGNDTIDTYPWETSSIARHKLNWKPRPVFQSYIAYTPFLDKQNADFYSSPNHPKFILWYKKHAGGETGSINQRYLFNDEPLTIYSILNHYRQVFENSRFVLLQRSPKSQLDKPKIIKQESVGWNAWLAVPERSANDYILRAKAKIQRSWLQKLKSLFYKEFEVYVIYKFDDGRQAKHRIVVDNTVNGLWVSPFQKKLLKYDWDNHVTSIKFTHTDGDFFESPIEIAWEKIRIRP